MVGAVVGLSLFGLPGLLLAAVGSGLLGSAGLYWVLVRRRGWRVVDFGFRTGAHRLTHLLWQTPLLLLLSLIATAAVGTSLGLTPSDNDQAATATQAQPGWIPIVAVILLFAIVVPLIEEIVFRRVLLDWLMLKLPTLPAAAIVIAVFALCHIDPAVMLYMLFFGTVLVGLRLWYRSLWAPLIYHVVNNALVGAISVLAFTG
ncbi:CPBP family intramembrane glutamic endopeptidase [Auritidibacter ignavus]|uniref:CPBP family intramembrane glutamic endopeptidase n=1 Tax=Auritidibacter ignavus TaxID=678932 RepID=UPI0015D628F0|nr:CPBP family intramembrane glutamic endopeptidase [Auritidibacter ignavus]